MFARNHDGKVRVEATASILAWFPILKILIAH